MGYSSLMSFYLQVFSCDIVFLPNVLAIIDLTEKSSLVISNYTFKYGYVGQSSSAINVQMAILS